MVNILAINHIEDIVEIYRRCRERNIIPEVADYIPTGRTQGGVLKEKKSIRENPHLTSEEKQRYLERLQPLTHQQKLTLEERVKEIDKEF
jgi:predicted SprT family Zn-dependent metalloprotease